MAGDGRLVPELNLTNFPAAGVILSEAVFQAERRISQGTGLLFGRSLVPLVKARDFGMTPRGVEFSVDALRDQLPEPATLAEAGTARVRAHSRSEAISSARVVESGTVCASASTSDCVVSGFFSE